MIGQNFVSNKIVYPREIYDNRKKLRYSLYLRVGNMNDILSLPAWEIDEIARVSKDINDESSGKKGFKPLTQSQRDMIQRAKEKRGK